MTAARSAALPEEILLAATPDAWVAAACERWQELLVDHLACEKKAASTALSLIFAYPEDDALTLALSRLAREELRHFEQVQALMRQLNVRYLRVKPGRYAGGLRAVSRTSEPDRKLDLLLTGALIEARSAERFAKLAPQLQAPLDRFYGQLQRSEARHFQLYLRLAIGAAASSGLDWRERLNVLAKREALLATEPDSQLRFHSGPPEATL